MTTVLIFWYKDWLLVLLVLQPEAAPASVYLCNALPQI